MRSSDLMAREAPHEAVAVCLLHSYLNPQHEQRIRALLAERHPDLPVILSSDVLPTFPGIRARVHDRDGRVPGTPGGPLYRPSRAPVSSRPRPAGGDLFVMQSSGGVLPGGGAPSTAVSTCCNSGPAAGVIGAVRMAEVVGDDNKI